MSFYFWLGRDAEQYERPVFYRMKTVICGLYVKPITNADWTF